MQDLKDLPTEILYPKSFLPISKACQLKTCRELPVSTEKIRPSTGECKWISEKFKFDSYPNSLCKFLSKSVNPDVKQMFKRISEYKRNGCGYYSIRSV